MSYGVIIAACIALGAIAIVFAVGLAVANATFAVKAGPLAEKILAALPGANCGACGYGGCAGYAEALASGKVPLGACVLGGPSAEGAIAAILGQSAEARAKEVAVVHCNRSGVRPVSDYAGLKDCKAALLATDALFECRYACLGLGTCSRACLFGAIAMAPDALPVVLEAKCTGCGVCVRACPKAIISLHADSRNVHVLCRSLDKGAVARKLCARACIACGSCVKVCPTNAIEIKDFLARIDYNKCVSCGNCVKECPTGAIGDFATIRRRNIDVA